MAVSNRVKKTNITIDNIGAIMLAQIPSVSTASAQVIMEKYKNIDDLITALHADSNALQNLTTTTKSGKKRKLTKTCTSNVYNYLLGKSDGVIISTNFYKVYIMIGQDDLYRIVGLAVVLIFVVSIATKASISNKR